MTYSWAECQAVIINDMFVYLTVGMVSQRLVGLINHHTLDLLSRTGLSGQIVHHDLRGEEENALGPPHVLPLLRRCAACGEGNGFLLTEAKREEMGVMDLVSSFVTCQLSHVRLWDPHHFITGLDLLGHQGFGGSHEYDLP